MRLHILHHAAVEEIHGAWLTEELARHGYDISPGTLYPTLHRLEADGLLISQQRVVDGRTRRIYRATKAGKQALPRIERRWRSWRVRFWVISDDAAPVSATSLICCGACRRP